MESTDKKQDVTWWKEGDTDDTEITLSKDILGKLEYMQELIRELKEARDKDNYTPRLVYEATYTKQYIKMVIGSGGYDGLDENMKKTLCDCGTIVTTWLKELDYSNVKKEKEYNKRDKLSEAKGNDNGYMAYGKPKDVKYVFIAILAILGVGASMPFNSINGIEWILASLGIMAVSFIVSLIVHMEFDDCEIMQYKRGYIISSIVSGIVNLAIMTLLIAEIREYDKMLTVWVIIDSIAPVVMYYSAQYSTHRYKVRHYDREGLNIRRLNKIIHILKTKYKLNKDESYYEMLIKARKIRDKIKKKKKRRNKDYWSSLAKGELLYEKCLSRGLLDGCEDIIENL